MHRHLSQKVSVIHKSIKWWDEWWDENIRRQMDETVHWLVEDYNGIIYKIVIKLSEKTGGS